MKENVKVNGYIKWEKFTDGVLVESGGQQNVITTLGKNALASLLASTSQGSSIVTHIGFGTSSTVVNASDTALGAELTGNGYARVPVTRSNPQGNVIQYVGALTGITSPVVIQEAGLLNAETEGVLFAHQLTGSVSLNSELDVLQITWLVEFT